jgi:hypothetical protein
VMEGIKQNIYSFGALLNNIIAISSLSTFLFISRLRHRRGPNPQDREPILDVQAHGSDDDQVPGTETATRFVKNKSRHLEHKTVVFFFIF